MYESLRSTESIIIYIKSSYNIRHNIRHKIEIHQCHHRDFFEIKQFTSSIILDFNVDRSGSGRGGDGVQLCDERRHIVWELGQVQDGYAIKAILRRLSRGCAVLSCKVKVTISITLHHRPRRAGEHRIAAGIK